ncbi:acyltransferase family protein [Streptomyces polyrhachis]|uniref:Acyltransferase family protein n=1 Tax=Streptomyces polyrhachis TaxID=1282885 RepID=A0ABW2GN10_9ACTN
MSSPQCAPRSGAAAPSAPPKDRPAPGGAAPDTASPPGRSAYFDNAKFLATVLVVVAHAWGPLRDSRAVDAVHLLVYTFHMPAFILISGYFSRGFTATPHRVFRLVTTLLVPYVVFEVAYTVLRRSVAGDADAPFTFFDPWYLTWFLVVLFIWRLSTPLWQALRWPLGTALAIAALASMTPGLGTAFDVQRVLQFLPFFVLGLTLRPGHFTRLRSWPVRLAALPVGAGAAVFSYWAVVRMDDEWMFRRASAQDMGAPAWTGPVMTLALFGCALVLAGCFLSWVPGRRTWFTPLGSATLYAYLLHGFVLKIAQWEDWYALDRLHTPLGEVGVTVFAAVMAAALCTAPVRRLLRFAVEPRLDWAYGGPRSRADPGRDHPPAAAPVREREHAAAGGR